MIRIVFAALALASVAAFVVGCEKSVKFPSYSVTATESGKMQQMVLPTVPSNLQKNN